MRVEDIQLREVLTKKMEKTVEVVLRTREEIANSIAPVNRNGIYHIRSLPVEDLTRKFLEIKRHFANQTFDDVDEVDKFLHTIDVSPDFREIGGNLAFAISSAFLKIFARRENIEIHEYLSKNKPELPTPLYVATDKKTTQTDFKEYILYPVQKKEFTTTILKIASIAKNLKFDSKMTNEKVIRQLASVTTTNSLQIGINFGAPDIWNERRYAYSTNENLIPQEQLLLVQDMAKNFPIGYIEDPFHEEDFVMSATLTHRLPTRIIVGNELYSNNPERFNRGVELKATNGIHVEPDKFGTITDFINMMKEAQKNKMSTVMSDGVDENLASNLATGLKIDYIKLDIDSAELINDLIRIENKME